MMNDLDVVLREIAALDVEQTMTVEIDRAYQRLCSLLAVLAHFWLADPELETALQIAAIRCHHCEQS